MAIDDLSGIFREWYTGCSLWALSPADEEKARKLVQELKAIFDAAKRKPSPK